MFTADRVIRVARITRILLNIILGLALAGTVAGIIFLVIAIAAREPQLGVTAGVLAVVLPVVMLVVGWMREIVGSMESYNPQPFHERNVQLLRRIGGILLVYAVFAFAEAVFTGADEGLPVMIGALLGNLYAPLPGLFLLFLAEVFSYGMHLEEQQSIGEPNRD